MSRRYWFEAAEEVTVGTVEDAVNDLYDKMLETTWSTESTSPPELPMPKSSLVEMHRAAAYLAGEVINPTSEQGSEQGSGGRAGEKREAGLVVPLLAGGTAELVKASERLGLGFDDFQIEWCRKLFVDDLQRQVRSHVSMHSRATRREPRAVPCHVEG